MARVCCFNPRTRVGCDLTAVRNTPHLNVSIHAPAWGATLRPPLRRGLFASFNPRTRVGCDAVVDRYSVSTNMFQSTHPRGVRPAGPLEGKAAGRVSIHAPAWGATRGTHLRASGPDGFNPRTRVGCDMCPCEVRRLAKSLFQSTHPRGVRRVGMTALGWVFSFNPRTRVGCDQTANPVGGVVLLFQSTHPRGVRPGERDQAALVQTVSIHAPAWGATWAPPGVRSRRHRFNPRTRVGCDNSVAL